MSERTSRRETRTPTTTKRTGTARRATAADPAARSTTAPHMQTADPHRPVYAQIAALGIGRIRQANTLLNGAGAKAPVYRAGPRGALVEFVVFKPTGTTTAGK